MKTIGDVKMQSLQRDGFVLMESVISDDDVNALIECSKKLLSKKSLHRSEFSRKRNGSTWQCEAYSDGKTNLVVDILGEAPELDKVINSIFENPNVKKVLHFLHGDSYKITQVNIRQVVQGDPGLNFHQDTDGETGMGIFLEDRPDEEGSTVFIPGSHYWPFKIRELFVYPRIFIPIIPKRWRAGATGKAGDMYFFINRAWHGRPALKRSKVSTAILISIFGQESTYRIHNMPEKNLDSLPGCIRGLVDHRQGVRFDANGLAVVEPAGDVGIMQREIFPNVASGLMRWILIPWVNFTGWVSSFRN